MIQKGLTLVMLIISVLFASANPASLTINDEIRRKIENESFTSFSTQLHCKQGLSTFYLNREFKQAWNEEQLKRLLVFLQSAEINGLNPFDYHVQKIQALGFGKLISNKEVADFDVLLSDAFLLLSSHLLSGKLDQSTLLPVWNIRREEADPIFVLEELLSSKDWEAAKTQLLPKEPLYQSMMLVLSKYRELKEQTWETIPEGATLKIGSEDARILAIASKLISLGDLDAHSGTNIYDENLQHAVQGFQKRHGLEDDGNIGAKTIAALNISIEKRIKQVKANLERWRWLPREFSIYYLVVNIAAFELELVLNSEIIAHHRIIAGKTARKTPVLSSRIKYLVLNPTWTVPPSILKNDILPAVQKDVNYLKKKNLSVYNNRGELVNPDQVDWNNSAARGYTYRQPAGKDNALGAVKFMFDNEFSVYLHDTPNRELFSQNDRALSSGCIRVQYPLELAETLLAQDNSYKLEEIKKIVAEGKTTTLYLKKQPEIHILYWTAWSDKNGVFQFRKDIYDRDNAIITGLITNSF